MPDTKQAMKVMADSHKETVKELEDQINHYREVLKDISEGAGPPELIALYALEKGETTND